MTASVVQQFFQDSGNFTCFASRKPEIEMCWRTLPWYCCNPPFPIVLFQNLSVLSKRNRLAYISIFNDVSAKKLSMFLIAVDSFMSSRKIQSAMTSRSREAKFNNSVQWPTFVLGTSFEFLFCSFFHITSRPLHSNQLWWLKKTQLASIFSR